MIITQQNIIRARWNTFNLCIYLCMPKTKVNCWPASFEVITPPPQVGSSAAKTFKLPGETGSKLGRKSGQICDIWGGAYSNTIEDCHALRCPISTLANGKQPYPTHSTTPNRW